MRLYPKQLNSLEELKREKHMLKYAKKRTRKEGLMPIGKKDLPLDLGKTKSSDILSLAGDLLTSRSITDLVMTLGLPALKLAGRKVEKGFIRKVAIEVLGGYAKWKVAYYGYKIAKGIVLSSVRKKKKKQTKPTGK